ncbi:DUF2812 domain-containing protein [Spirillospora sp. CA-142024]|uniref:DUF2812 domain-containing protein n=1 Tax=Spirillospora sp. CA-142024 TaxID=3240036 RepID=UPI003D928143
MTDSVTYFQKLTALLREKELPQERIEAVVGELQAHAEDAGSEPEEEFGPVEQMAAQLTERDRTGVADVAEEPEDGAESWVLRVDALKERELLNRFGAEGWEVDGLDRIGGFVCRRDPHRPMRWRYRRETAGVRQREELTERLGPDGWEPCGVWGPYAYYKRPEAASSGPAAQLAEPPAAPRKRVYFSTWVVAYLVVSVSVAMGALVWLGWTVRGMSASERAGAVFGLLLLALLGGAAWMLSRRKRPSDRKIPKSSQ